MMAPDNLRYNSQKMHLLVQNFTRDAMFDWEDLRYFSVFARQRSLSQAAQQLGVDHATVARRIASLEQALGLKLVDRRPRSYLLTTDGERIAGLGTHMEAQAYAVDRAAQAAQAGHAGLSGEVVLSAPPSLSHVLVAPRLGELRRDHPHLHLQLLAQTQKVSLSQREADLALRLSRPTEQTLAVRKLGNVSYGLYASAAYLQGRDPKDYEFIGYDLSLEDTLQQRWLKANAGQRPIALRCSSLDTQKVAALSGAGVVALPHFMGKPESGLLEVEAVAPPVSNDIWLLVHQDMREAPTVRAVIDFLARCIEAGRVAGLLS
jgi:DNA-binding transcriptional LysR family regulator